MMAKPGCITKHERTGPSHRAVASHHRGELIQIDPGEHP